MAPLRPPTSGRLRRRIAASTTASPSRTREPDGAPAGALVTIRSTVPAPLDLLLERMELDLAKEELRAFGLKQQLSRRGEGIESFIDEDAVDVVLDVAAAADRLAAVPLA